MVHEKNRRESLRVLELYHPQGFLWILAAFPVCRNLTSLPVPNRGRRFYLVVHFWLDWSTGSPFLPFNMFTWHSYGIGIYPTRVSPCSSNHTVAWHSWRCHGWWGRWAWGRRWMINFLHWRCHGCWRGEAWGRTRWQTRNQDRNEVLSVALYPNTVFNEMWFLTVDPLVKVSVFIAKLSKL